MTKSKKIQKVAKTVEVVIAPAVVSPEEKRRALLAKALGKKVEDVHIIPEGKDEVVEALTAKALKNAKDRPEPKHDPIPINEDIKEESDEEELEIVEVPAQKGKKVISQNTKQAEKLLAKAEAEKAAKEAANLKELQESIAADQAKTAAKEKAAKEKEAAKSKGKKTEEVVAPHKLTPQEISAKALAAKRAKAANKTADQITKEEVEEEQEEELVEDEKNDAIEALTLVYIRRFKLTEKKARILAEAELSEEEEVEEVIPEPKPMTRKPVVTPAPIKGKVIPEGTTGTELKRMNKADAKKAKKGNKGTAKTTVKRTKTNDAPKFTRMQAVGIVMKANPDESVEEIVTMADALYTDMTGADSNEKETATQVGKAQNFLLGYNAE